MNFDPSSKSTDPHRPRPTPRSAWSRRRRVVAVLLCAIIIPAGLFVGHQVRLAYQVSHYQTETDFYGFEWDYPPPLSSFHDVNVQIDQSLISRSNVPPNGIRSITDPQVIAAHDAVLHPHERIVVVTVNDVTRGYPIRYLRYHEAINDRLGGVPIVVLYCPLCDSVSVCDRVIGETEFEFLISGLLMHSNVLLYDRQFNGVWSQVGGMTAVCGEHAGASLPHRDAWSLLRCDTFLTLFPQATVVNRPTAHERDYERNTYADYFAHDELIERFAPHVAPDSFANKTPVIGIERGDETRAYVIEHMRELPGGRLHDTFADGATIAMTATTDGQVRIIDVPDDAVVVHTFWFAWRAFHPETTVAGSLPRIANGQDRQP